MQWYERLDEKIRDYLPDMTVERDVPMSRHTSFRIGGPARRMAFPESREQLVILLGLAEEMCIRDSFRALAEAYCSQQPRRPQGQGRP